MTTYFLLPHPGMNAVFFSASASLSLAELSLCLQRLSAPCAAARVQTIAGLRYYAFDAEHPLSEPDIRILSRLSSLYALFMQEGKALIPIEILRHQPFSEELSSILKYTGKTNALFTRLLLHVAELSLDAAENARSPDRSSESIAAGEALRRPIRLLDPIAGKGTTLYEGLMRGFQVAGIEVVYKAAHESAVYFQKYLETEKWKHKVTKEKRHGAHSWRYAFARDKETLKLAPGECIFVAGDAKDAVQFFGKSAFDIIAGDLPYGVAHGNIAGSQLSRSPKGLLEACLPAWHQALQPGGVVALSFNTLTFSAESMAETLTRHGFFVHREPPYDAFAHRVDASIRRDIVIAIKKKMQN